MFCTKGKDMWILLVFLAIPLIEIALFVQIGGHIGVIGTLAEILCTAALGLVLMRLEPHRNAHEVRAALDRDANPASPLAHSALRLVGAVLLVLPGFFSDAAGLVLLLPPVRMLILGRLFARLQAAQTKGSVIIEGEYEAHSENSGTGRDAHRPALPDQKPGQRPRGNRPENRD